MKILHVHSLHGHAPWMRTVSDWAPTVDAITVAGDSLPIVSSRSRDDDEFDLRHWIAGLKTPVFYSRGAHDPADMEDWDYDHLFLSGSHEFKGWTIQVLDVFSTEIWMPEASSLPEILVTHFPPAGAVCGTDTPSGECYGRADVRAIGAELGDVRLVLAGRVPQPKCRVDWCEGSMCVVPGANYYEHTQEPAFARIDTDTRSITVFDGKRVASCSFAR